jgi:hypothetical protein
MTTVTAALSNRQPVFGRLPTAVTVYRPGLVVAGMITVEEKPPSAPLSAVPRIPVRDCPAGTLSRWTLTVLVGARPWPLIPTVEPGPTTDAETWRLPEVGG